MISPDRRVSGRIRAAGRVAARTLRQVWHGLQRLGMLMSVICRRGKGRKVLGRVLLRPLQMSFERA